MLHRSARIGLAAITAAGAAFAVGAVERRGGEDSGRDQRVRSALSAAPHSIAAQATVMEAGEGHGGGITVLRRGTNGWTCFPDNPASPGADPMCLDKGGMGWMDAWMAHKPPELPAAGIGYMLRGGSDPSTTDPFAMAPPAGQGWVNEGSHVMIFPPTGLNLSAYGTDVASGRPWVTLAGTPYEHLHIPVGAPGS